MWLRATFNFFRAKFNFFRLGILGIPTTPNILNGGECGSAGFPAYGRLINMHEFPEFPGRVAAGTLNGVTTPGARE